MAYMAKGAVRSIKNFGKGYSDIQAKVRAATSNDPWGPSGRAMNEIAQATYNNQDFIEIMEMIDKRLNDSGKNWRHVFKALHLLDYCLHAGSDNVVLYAKDNLYVVKTLREFQYIDELGKDQGANVRQKAKEITNLLQDDQLLKEERRSHATMRDRMFGRNELGSDRGIGGDRIPTFEQSTYFDEDAEMKKAIEESMKSQEDYEKRKKQNKKEEEEMAKAIQLSKEEEEKRKRAEEAAKLEQSLFGDTSTSITPTPLQQQQSQTDFFNPLNDQFTTTQFNQFGNNSVQQTPYEIFSLQNQNLNAAQFSTNPYQQQLLQLQQQQQQQQNNAYQQQLSPQQLPSVATTIGSNNPFGPFTQQQQTTFGSTSPLGTNGSLSSLGNDSLQLQAQQTSFGNSAFSSPGVPSLTTLDSTLTNQQQSNNEKQQLLLQQQFKKPQTIHDEKFAKLNELLAKGEGQDTFGNVGELRVPIGTGFSNTISTPLRSNSINSTGNNTLTQGNPFFKSEGNAPHSGTFSNSQPNLALGAQPINNTDLFGGTFSGSNSSYTSGLNTPSSPFSTASSYAATSNSLIDLGSNTSDFGQTSKNPFQIPQNTNPLINVNKPKSLNELQQQQGFNPYGQQSANGSVGFGNTFGWQ